MPLLTLGALCGVALSLMALSRCRSSGLCLFSGIACMVLLTYLGGLAGLLRPTAHVVWFGGQALLLFWGVQALRGRGPLTAFFSQPGPWLLLGLCLAHWLLFRDAQLLYWDEFSHWALAPKELYHRHALYAANVNLSHAHYLPGAPLWHYLVTLHAGFTPGTLYVGQFMLLLTPFLAFFEGLDRKRLWWILPGLAVCLLLIANLGQGVAMLLVDGLLGAWTGGALLFFLAATRRDEAPEASPPRSLLLLGPVLAMVVLIKDVGLVLALATAGLLLCTLLLRRRREGRGGQGKALLVLGATLVLLPLLAYGSWNLRNALVSPQSGAGVKSGVLESVWHLATGGALQDYQHEVLRRFGEVVVHQQQSRTAFSYEINEFSYDLRGHYPERWHLSALGWGLCFLALMLLRLLLTKDQGQRKELALWAVWLGGLLGLYLLMLLCLYLFVFSPEGGLRLASYIRYVNIVLLPLIMVGLGVFFPLGRRGPEEGPPQGRRLTVAALAVLLGLYLLETPYTRPLYTANTGLDSFRLALAPHLPGVRAALGGQDRLYVILTMESNGILPVMLKYELSPVLTTVSPHDVLQQEPKQLEALLGKQEYVLLLVHEERLLETLQPLLPQPLPQTLLYRTVLTPQGLRLQPVLP